MNDVCREYSEALFSLAVEDGLECEYINVLNVFRAEVQKEPKFTELLASPCIPLIEKKQVVDAVFDGGDAVEKNISSFLKLLCETGHIRELFDMIDETLNLLRLSLGISTAKVISAVELTRNEKDKLSENLEKKLGHRVELDCMVDKSLIGGIIVEADGKVIDGSIRYKLQNIKEIIK